MTQSAPQAGSVLDAPISAKVGMGLAVLAALSAAMYAVGGLGPGLRAPADVAFAPAATLLSPAAPAFAIWVVIYAGLFGHSVRLWLPDPRAYDRRRRTMWPATMSMLLNALWLLCAARGLVWADAALALLLLADVGAALEGARTTPAAEATSVLLIDGTYGVYLGWLLVVTPTTLVAAVDAALGLDPAGAAAMALALTLLVAATAATLWATRRFGGNLGIALAWCWGLVWLVRARTHDEPASWPVTITAILAAGLVAAAAATAPRGRPVPPPAAGRPWARS